MGMPFFKILSIRLNHFYGGELSAATTPFNKNAKVQACTLEED
jgi:hypothetical protein